MTLSSPDLATSLVGTVVADRYRVTALLGVGGMGAVYSAEHILMRKRVALKVLHPDMVANEEVVSRFEREAMAAAHVDHPNVAAATDFGRTPDGAFFLVLEYLEGHNLRVVLDQGALPISRALAIARQIASALVRAHSFGIVHRDLKPENVMILQRGSDNDFVKILDFGIAKVPIGQLTGHAGAAGAAPLTRLGVIYGTPEYMAPEQALGKTVDARADLYALGVMLYEMLTGVRPFHADNPVVLVTLHISAQPPPFCSLPLTSPLGPDVEAMVMQLLQKEPDHRYACAADLLSALDHLFVGTNPSTASSLAAVVGAPRHTQIKAPATPPAGGPEAFLATYIAPAVPADREIAPPAAALQGNTSQVIEVPHSLRVTLSTLGRDLHRLLPAPVRAIAPRSIALGLAALVTVAIAFGLGLSVRHHPPAAAPRASARTETSEEAGLPHATARQLEQAKTGGISPLKALAEAYPKDIAVLRTLAFAYTEQAKHRDAVATWRSLTLLEANTLSDDAVQRSLRAALLSDSENEDAVFSYLESSEGPGGPDFLYELGNTKELPNKIQSRAQKSMTKSEVRERASETLRATLDLRQATSCEGKRATLTRIRDHGDARAVPFLKQLNPRKGCGIFKQSDCWSCLRRDSQLTDALRAAAANETRSPPP